MSLVFKTIASDLGFKLKEYRFAGNDFNFENLDSVLNHLQISQGDVVFFYLSSHGFRSNSNDSFPRIRILKKDGAKGLYSGSTINGKLVEHNKGAACIVTMMQACNHKKSNQSDLPHLLSLLTPVSSNHVFDSLFLSRKNVLVTSSQKGKVSYNDSKGSFFTRAFGEAVFSYSEKSNVNKISWPVFIQQVNEKYKANQHRRDLRKAVWRVDDL